MKEVIIGIILFGFSSCFSQGRSIRMICQDYVDQDGYILFKPNSIVFGRSLDEKKIDVVQYKMSGDSTFLINSLQVKTADFIKYYYSAKENIAVYKDFGELDFKYDSLRSSKRFTELGRERLVLLNKSEYVVLEKDKLGNPFLFILKDTTVLGVKELDRSIAFGKNEMILLDVDNDGSNEIIVFSYNFIESRPSVVCSVFKW